MQAPDKTSFFYRYKLHHILFWLVYALAWYWFGQLSTPTEHRGLTTETIQINMVYLFTHAAASYISIYGLMPRYLYARKYAAFFLLLTVLVIVFSVIVAAGFYFVFRDNPGALEDIFRPGSIIPATFFSVASTVGMVSAAKLMQNRRQAERKHSRLENEKLQAELNYLKAQINPHFLFNAINNIYFLIKKDKDLAGDMLLKFSELLRYQLYDCNTDSIPVQTEIAHLQNFIELEKIRKGDKVKVSFENRITRNFSISPLVLMPFVENAFKYVAANKAGASYIDIKLDYNEPDFLFIIENTTAPEVQSAFRTGGIGQENVKRRLDLLYKNRHRLDIKQSPGQFQVSLNIDVIHADQ